MGYTRVRILKKPAELQKFKNPEEGIPKDPILIPEILLS
jgi:hypothetical protein